MRLSLNWHLYKTDTKSLSLPFFATFLCLTLCKTDISLRRALNGGVNGVHLEKSWLYNRPGGGGVGTSELKQKNPRPSPAPSIQSCGVCFFL